MTSPYREQAERALASIINADDTALRRLEVGLVYYDESAWSALHGAAPAAALGDHTRAIDWLGRELAQRGVEVKAKTIGLRAYRSWLKVAGREDSQDARAAWACETGYRLGLMIEPNAIGWCLLDQPAPSAVLGAARIAAIRRERRQSVRAFAERFGLNYRTLQRVEAGGSVPPLHFVLALLDELGAPDAA